MIRFYLFNFFSALIIAVFGLSFQLYASQPSSKWYSHSFDVMGTQAKIEFESDDVKKAKELTQQLVSEMQRIDSLMSPYKPDSELSLVNQKAAQKPLKISQELFFVVKRSMEFSHITNGAFDITFSSVGYLYDYPKQIKPSKEVIAELKTAIDYKQLILNEAQTSIYFKDDRIRIDLGGIAKGYAVDRCIELLKSAGIKNAYVNAGGDSRLIGKKNNRLWYIGIRHPRDENKFLTNLPLEEVALSTSGDYERFFIQDEIRYHHIINPQTGTSAKQVQSVTILAEDSLTADALSTSVFVLGVNKGLSLINHLADVSAIIVDNQGKLFVSDDMTSIN